MLWKFTEILTGSWIDLLSTDYQLLVFRIGTEIVFDLK